MNKLAIFSFMVTLILLSGSPTITSADNLALGQQAEQIGNLRQALSHYVEALKTDENNQQLREKVIKLAQKIQPPPAIPEEVHRHMARGEAFLEAADDSEGFQRSANEFQSASKAAPWLASIYYNEQG